MTVIAWDGKTLAADKRATCGGGIARTVTKIRRVGNVLTAVSGDWDVACELRAWWEAGSDPSAFPDCARDGDASLMVFAPGYIATFTSGPYPLPIEAERCAFGSGRDYAEAAMHLGFSAKRAVEVACHFQTDCGNGIDILKL